MNNLEQEIKYALERNKLVRIDASFLRTGVRLEAFPTFDHPETQRRLGALYKKYEGKGLTLATMTSIADEAQNKIAVAKEKTFAEAFKSLMDMLKVMG